MGKSQTVHGGYRNYLTFQAWVCSGPVDYISEVRWGGRQALLRQTAPGAFRIDAEDLYAGDNDEGGISGDCVLEDGDAAQGASAILARIYQTGLVPAFRYITQVIFDDFLIGNSPYAKEITFVPTRFTLKDDYSAEWNAAQNPIYSEQIESQNPPVTEFPILPFANLSSTGPQQLPTETDPANMVHRGWSKAGSGTDVSARYGTVSSGGESFARGDDGYMIRVSGGSFNFNYAYLGLQIVELLGQNAAVQSRISISFEMGQGAPGIGSNCRAYLRDQDGDILAQSEVFGPTPYEAFNFDVAIPDGTTTLYLHIESGPNGFVRNVSWSASSTVTPPDANAAHIIRQLLTDARFGFGKADAEIDSSNFSASATTLYDEGFGLSIEYFPGQKSPVDLINDVCKIIDAVLVISPRTGLYKLNLVRPGDAVTLALGDGDIIAVDIAREERNELANRVTVKFMDRRKQREGSVTRYNNAAARAAQNVISSDAGLPPYIHSEALALRVCERELRAASIRKLKGTIVATRVAAGLEEGQKISVTSTPGQMIGVNFRILKINRGSPTSREVRLEVVQDVFDMVSEDIGQDARPTSPLVETPQPAELRSVTEAPYFFMAQAVGDAQAQSILAEDAYAGFIMIAAEQPTGLHRSADIHTDAAQTGEYVEVGRLEFGPADYLAAPLAKYGTSFDIVSAVGLDFIEAGDLALVGGEYVSVVSISGTTVTVERGFLDTVPVAHSIGEEVFFLNDYWTVLQEEYGTSDVVDVRLVTRTDRGALPLYSAPVDTLTFANRAIRPYPAQNMTLEGVLEPVLLNSGDVLDWERRNRLDTVPYAFDAGDQTPEGGTASPAVQVYRIRFFAQDEVGNEDPTHYFEDVVPSGPYTMQSTDYADLAPDYARAIRIEITTLRLDASPPWESWQSPSLVVPLFEALLTEDDGVPGTEDIVITEDDQTVLFEGNI